MTGCGQVVPKSNTTSCCGAHALCGADCDGAYEIQCDCGNPVCQRCAASFDFDERCTGKCVECAMADAGVVPL